MPTTPARHFATRSPQADGALAAGARLVGCRDDRARRRGRAIGPRRYRAAAALRDPGRDRRGAARASGSRRRAISVTASARSPRHGPPAPCRSPMPRASSSRAAASRSERAAKAAWRRWRWAARRPSELLREIGSPLEIGAINADAIGDRSPARATRSNVLAAEARRRGVACRALDLDFAFHSAAMDPIRDDLLADLAGLVVAPRRKLCWYRR